MRTYLTRSAIRLLARAEAESCPWMAEYLRAKAERVAARAMAEPPEPPRLPRGTRVRVELPPACDDWMRGDRFGEVVGYGRARDYRILGSNRIERDRPYLVRLDKSGRVRRFRRSTFYIIT